MIQILKQNGEAPYGLNEYIIDEKEELSKIPKNISMGSSVFIIEENKTYVLDGKKEWVEKISAAAGGIAQETDPTVPNWAKSPLPPLDKTYNPNSSSTAPTTKVVEKRLNELVPNFYINNQTNYIETFGTIKNNEQKFKFFYLIVSESVKDLNNQIILPESFYVGYKVNQSITGNYRLKDCYNNTIKEYNVHWVANKDAPTITPVSTDDPDLTYIPTSSKPQSGTAVKQAIDEEDRMLKAYIQTQIDKIELNGDMLTYHIPSQLSIAEMLENLLDLGFDKFKIFSVHLEIDLIDKYDTNKILPAGKYIVFKTDAVNGFIFKNCNSSMAGDSSLKEYSILIQENDVINIMDISSQGAELEYNKESILPQSGRAVRQAIDSAIPHYFINSIEDFSEIIHKWNENDQYGDARKIFSINISNPLVADNGNRIYSGDYFCLKEPFNNSYIILGSQRYYTLDIALNESRIYKGFQVEDEGHYFQSTTTETILQEIGATLKGLEELLAEI